MLKGLIKLAAAGVKAREGRPQGVMRHAKRAQELLHSCAEEDCPELSPALRRQCGHWARLAQAVNEQAEELLNTSAEAVVVVFDFAIEAPLVTDS